jgi:hypothetical protein
MVPALALQRHPDTPCEALRAVTAHLSRNRGTLALSYRLVGDLERVRVPSVRPGRRADRLWEHTCCEIFIARAGTSAYHEFNFSPSSEWAAYAFTRYREGGLLSDEALDPQVTLRTDQDQLELDAVIRLDRLSAGHALQKLSIGLSVVVEEQGGRMSYWALKHAPGKPDFHHPQAFAVELDEIRN